LSLDPRIYTTVVKSFNRLGVQKQKNHIEEVVEQESVNLGSLALMFENFLRKSEESSKVHQYNYWKEKKKKRRMAESESRKEVTKNISVQRGRFKN